jgi:DNA-binding beta-propeller fold protein YncE
MKRFLPAVPAILVALTISRAPWSLAAERATLSDPSGLAMDRAGNLLVSCRGTHSVVVMSRSGQALRQFGADRLTKPGGLCVLADGRIVVADAGRNELAVFDADGRFAASVAGLSGPEDVAAGPDGRLYVADTGNSRVVVLDAGLEKILFAVDQAGDPPLKLKAPAGVAVGGGRLVVSDTGNRRVLAMPVPVDASGGGKATAIGAGDMAPGFLAVGRDGAVHVADGRAVRGFARDGRPLGVFGAKAIRVTVSYLFEPGGLAVDARGNVLAVDRHTARVFVTDAKLLDPVPEVTLDPKDPTTATIEWTSPSPQPTIVEYGTTDEYGQWSRSAEPTARHRAVLAGLSPATRYQFRLHKPFEMIPEASAPKGGFSLRHQVEFHRRIFEGNVSRNDTFVSWHQPGRTDWAMLPVAVLVYRNVKFPARDGKQPPNRVLDEEDIALLKSEMEKYRTWAWRQSGCKLNLCFTYVLVEQERDHQQLGGVGKEILDDLVKGVSAQAKDLHAFWNVIVVGTHGWYANYLDGTVAGSDYELSSCYAGFGHGQKPGWWWFPVHEHGHLLHSMFMNSALDTFGYPDSPWTMPGQFGEDFSFMAANYRRQPARSWLALRTAVVRQSDDRNANGVPDDDPDVPLDEKRFGWTDGPGGDCLSRMRAGIRDIFVPRNTDTDLDGQVHRLNDGQMYWTDRKVPKATPVLDGRLAAGEWQEFYSVPNLCTPERSRGLKARLYLAWDDGHYYLAVRSDKQVVAGFDLDGANDGWFHGRDNLRVSVRPPMGGRKLEVSGAIWDFLNDRINLHDGQHWYRQAYQPDDIRAAVGEQDGWYVIECAVPARAAVRIAPSRDARFALRVSLWAETPGAATQRVEFFDGEEFLYDLRCTAAPH